MEYTRLAHESVEYVAAREELAIARAARRTVGAP